MWNNDGRVDRWVEFRHRVFEEPESPLGTKKNRAGTNADPILNLPTLWSR
jgi:hypothetical protein